MGIAEDREELNGSGLRGVVSQLRLGAKMGYVVITNNGWNGQIVAEKPSLGTAPFLQVTPGSPVLRYENRELSEQPTEFREHV